MLIAMVVPSLNCEFGVTRLQVWQTHTVAHTASLLAMSSKYRASTRVTLGRV